MLRGAKAITHFSDVHVETPSSADSNFEVTNGASASVVGPTQFGNTIVHLTSTGTAITVKNVLGSSGSQVVKDDVNGVNNLGSYVANYSSSPAVPSELPSIRSYAVMDDEFFTKNTSDGTIGALGWSDNLTGGIKNLTGTANHPGQIQRNTSTTINTVAQLSLGDTSGLNPPIASLSNVAFHAWFIVEQDPSSVHASTQETWIIGFVNNPSTTTVTDGIYFSNVSGAGAAAWTANCTSSSTGMTTTNTSTTNLDTNWHTFEIINVVTAGPTNNVTFLIDGTAVGSAIATNIPTAALTPTFMIKNTEMFTKAMDVDAFKFSMAVTR